MAIDTSTQLYDLFVVGGGINGAGIARDAAGRGLSVFLCEKGDLAQGTSSASSKMIHGGLRYLEFYEFRLVREALAERETLLNSAPHIIWPMEFVLPHVQGVRPLWLVRLGLFLYDHLARRKHLAHSYGINLRESRFGKPLKKFVKEGFVYSDCWVEDSRLVVLNATDAAEHGATVHTYTTFLSATRENDRWKIQIKHPIGREETIYARYIVNAAGPGVNKIAARIIGGSEQPRPLRLVKGSHIVVPRLYDGEHAYILQHSDRRMVFVIPFEDHYTLIGTTDQPAGETELDAPKISQREIDYLLEAVNMYFNHQLTPADIHYTYSGIRPLFDDGSTEAQRVTRDYMITLENQCVTVFGGKITTFRRLAEEVVNQILDDMGDPRQSWTGKAILPGGDIGGSLAGFTQKMVETYPFLPESLVTRLSTQYGTRLHEVLKGVHTLSEMGQDFGNHLYAVEVDYLMRVEWARSAEDILLRRTRIGLSAADFHQAALQEYIVAKKSEFE